MALRKSKMGSSTRAIKRYRTRRLATIMTKAYFLHRRKRDEEMYNLVCNEFLKFGGVYTKFLQGVLFESEVMRKWQSPDKLRVFENLDTEPLDIADILRHELEPEKLAQIASIQPQPFAAGSFGQVYYGEHRDGRPIIIKVLRPMIRELLRYDLKLLSVFSKRFFVRMYPNMQVKIDEAVKDFIITTLRETDYVEEAKFANELREAYKDHPYLFIPQTFMELCTPNIIVQEYVGGLSVAQLIKLKQQGVDPVSFVKEVTGSDLDEQLETLGYELLTGVFKLPRIQGDPHPGNIRLMSGNRVGLIDFGISAKAPTQKAAFFGLLEAYDQIYKGSQTVVGLFENSLRFFVSDLYKALHKLASVIGQQQQKDYVKEVGKVAEETFASATGSNIVATDFKQDRSILVVLNKIINEGNRFGLVVKLEAADILRATRVYATLMAELKRYERVMPRIQHRVVLDIKRDFPNIMSEQDGYVSISDAMETVASWLGRVAERDPLLFKQLMERIKFGGENKVMDIKEAVNA